MSDKVETEYTIKILSTNGSDVKSIRLPKSMMKFALASLAVGALLFVGAVGYSVYSTFANRNRQEEIERLKDVNEIQQEQLLQLSKKASSLQEQIDQLTQMEAELRHISAGTSTGDEKDKPSDGEEHKGEGGPSIAPSLENVSQTFDNLEKRIAERRASLLQLKKELDQQRTGVASVMPPDTTVSVPGISSTIPAIWPARGTVTSPYGLRWGGSDFHPGIDIANDMGTPIVATADGVVSVAGWNSGGYGNMVDINHGGGIMTRYGHAMQIVVSPGQHVKRGQVIAYMGSTGFSTGPHVHYEVRINGQAVNPITYLH